MPASKRQKASQMSFDQGRLRVLGCALLLAVLITGCTTLHEYIDNGYKVGPNYARPPAVVAEKWIDSADPRVRTDPDELRTWWKVFGDPALEELICAALHQNLTLRQQSFVILEYQAILGTTLGRLFPQQQYAYGSYARQAISLETANVVPGAVPKRFFSTWTEGLALVWELDIWGKFRRAIEAAQAEVDLQVESYDDILVTLLADVATAYTQYRIFEREIELVRTNVKLQEETLKIAVARFKGGLVSELDVDQATSILQQTKAEIPRLETLQRQAQNQLCFLVGIPPVDLKEKLGKGAIPKTPTEVAVGIPCDLLRRRPDVRKAERDAAARCALIGIRESEFYPAVSLAGTIGYQGEYLGDLFNTKALFGQIGPQFRWNLLNYGRIANEVLRAEARFQAAVVGYQQTVLNANREVEDGLVRFLLSQQRTKELDKSVEAAEKSVKIALAQYGAGRIDFNRVSVIEQNLVQQQDEQAKAEGDIALGLIAVYRSLGGGWQLRLDGCPPKSAPVATVKDSAPNTLPAPKPVEKKPANGENGAKPKDDGNGDGSKNKPADAEATKKVGA